MEDNIHSLLRKMTLSGRLALMEDNLYWNGRQFLMEDKFNERRALLADDLI